MMVYLKISHKEISDMMVEVKVILDNCKTDRIFSRNLAKLAKYLKASSSDVSA
jgi:hypothetical protein